MSDKDFDLLKEKELVENDQNYGEEVKTQWGDEIYTKSQAKYKAMTQEDHQWAAETHRKIVADLAEAARTENQSLGLATVALHREWLSKYWSEESLTPEAHIGLGEMYVMDERFTKTYDETFPGAAAYLSEMIRKYYGR